MPRWLEIALTLILFTAGMAVLSWAVNATVPDVHAWLIAHLGQAGFWSAVVAFWIIAGFFAWKGHRTPKDSRGRLEGR